MPDIALDLRYSIRLGKPGDFSSLPATVTAKGPHLYILFSAEL